MEDDLTEEKLDKMFIEEFDQFRLKEWQAATTESRRLMKNLLLQRGVFARGGRGLHMVEHIIERINSKFID